MSAPIGTRIEDPDGFVFTKVAEDTWKSSEDDIPRTAADGFGYAVAIGSLEEQATGGSTEFWESHGYKMLEPVE